MSKEEQDLQLLREELEELESSDDMHAYGSPEPEVKDNQFKFFREMLNLDKSWKVGNLNEQEIGKSRLSIKSNLEIAQYLDAEGLDIAAHYFTERAQIMADASMGRKGFMPQLFVTQIKKEQRVKDPVPQKKSFFGGKKNESEYN